MDVITSTGFHKNIPVSFDELEIRFSCKVCREQHRRPGLLTFLRREIWPDDVPPAADWDWRIVGLENPHLFPVIVYRCPNTACTYQPRIRLTAMRDLFKRRERRLLKQVFVSTEDRTVYI